MLVEHARHPIFYAEFKVADNLDGRFDMIVLHMILVLRRYKEHKDLDMVNHIQNAFFKDMDRNLREMGVGDVTVPKKIKKMAEAYLGRSNAYTLPFDEKNKNKICDAFDRNIDAAEGNALLSTHLCDYALAQEAHLACIEAKQLASGDFVLIAPTPSLYN